ncbi:hypothetical protein ACIQZI_15510 [Peribacillus sp. NPDC096379]|uniref:hypothetical protein n=1 Tax=Peribacillus sp. NPDC096379 TaxID=3364393 RepID=UPI0037F7D4DD
MGMLNLEFLTKAEFEGCVTVHESNRSKTDLEENLITIRDNTVRTVALHLKGFDVENSKKLLHLHKRRKICN